MPVSRVGRVGKAIVVFWDIASFIAGTRVMLRECKILVAGLFENARVGTKTDCEEVFKDFHFMKHLFAQDLLVLCNELSHGYHLTRKEFGYPPICRT